MEEDIKIIKKHYVFTTNHVLDDENKQFKQAIENLINKYKEQEAVIIALRGAKVYLTQELKTEKAKLKTRYLIGIDFDNTYISKDEIREKLEKIKTTACKCWRKEKRKNFRMWENIRQNRSL